MNRYRSVSTRSDKVHATPAFVITCEVESAYTQPVELGTTTTPVEFIRERINGVARLAGDPVSEVWEDGDEIVARFASGTHRIYRVMH
ncbi:hypothetical protein GS921_13415 [Rhodococcus hoagii]|nr:hypothetical protein [Prescottella equi]